MENKFALSFIGGQLFETVYLGSPDYKRFVSIRGKTGGAYGNVGTFQWTSAVQALAVLSIRTAAYDSSAPIDRTMLSGQAGTLASSLDYAIVKSPVWLMEMFGVHSKGEGYMRRLVKITNSNRKRPGPVVLAINKQILAPEQIEVYIDGCRCMSKEMLHEFADRIEMSWNLENRDGVLAQAA